MNIERAIYVRNLAYDNKHYKFSDKIRKWLESVNVFIFDHPDGFHEVHYYPYNTNRKEVESMLRKDRLANKLFDAWLKSHST